MAIFSCESSQYAVRESSTDTLDHQKKEQVGPRAN